MYDVRTVYSLQQTVKMLRKALDRKAVTITRWSDTNFTPVPLHRFSMIALDLKPQNGCFAFIKGMENNRALNHIKVFEWHKHTLYSEAKISIEEEVIAPSHERYKCWMTIKDYIYYFLDRYYLLLEKYGKVTWDDIGFCNGIFIPASATISNIQHPTQPKWSSEVYRNQALILEVS